MQNTKSLDNILTERGDRYGNFLGQAVLSQYLTGVMHNHDKWKDLRADQKEAIEMICHKLARIVNGDPNYADSWIDIAGYATLISDRLERGMT